MLRTHTCGQLRDTDAGCEATLCGWVDTVRDHGGIIFIDLRDRYGVTQVIFDPDDSVEARDTAHSTRGEYVIKITGVVETRPVDMVNPRLDTGMIEVRSHAIEILSQSPTPPFPLEEGKADKVQEDLRLSYRYLDLRRAKMREFLRQRHKMSQAARTFLDSRDFIEVETPILTKSTPEGARDYLVPNRITPGTFYALPQAPQQYKQILMVAGFDRYFQMARCFRDEDLRADRQPEFTQIDIEMSFVEPHDLYEVIDGILASVMEAAGHGRPPLPLPRMSWETAMNTYGSDKPDLRFDMPLVDISKVFEGTDFKVFGKVLENGGVIKAINAKGLAGVPIRIIDEWTDLAKQSGLGGLAYIRVQDDGTWKSPIVKFFSDAESDGLRDALAVENGDLVLFAADTWEAVTDVLGKLRLLAGAEAGIIDEKKFCFTWVTEFPMFEKNEEGRLTPMHHPFCSIHPDDAHLLEEDPSRARALAYDVVLNGVELGSGSIRIHDSKLQARMFDLLQVSAEEQASRFGHLLKALSFGAPPHGGFAIGYDRLVALMVGADTIRDVIAFPKNHRGADLMMDAPGPVAAKQLKDVHLSLDLPDVVTE